MIELNEVDRRIWAEELDSFVPKDVYDIHTHCYRWRFNTDPAKETGSFAGMIGRDFPESGHTQLDALDAALLPGRKVHRLSFGFPFRPSCDFDASNRFVAEQARQTPGCDALMLVHPSMSRQYLEEQIRTRGFLGFKPYIFYAASGDSVECGITDFLPEEQIDVAHRHGLIVMLHLGKRDAIADQENIDDLLRLNEKYDNVKWILAHCARSYLPCVVERAIKSLRGLHNVWYDTSSVCNSDVIEVLTAGVGPDRVMYGSDDLPVGASRGTYITFAYAWAFLSEKNHSLDLSHCNPQMTFVRYEQLRAMRYAVIRLGLSRNHIENMFHNTAARLVQSVRDALH